MCINEQTDFAEAFSQTCVKILRANLFTDSYTIIKNDDTHKITNLNNWFEIFTRTKVKEEYRKDFREFANTYSLREYFIRNPQSYFTSIDYLRRNSGNYVPATMIVAKTSEYSVSNPVVYIFVREVSAESSLISKIEGTLQNDIEVIQKEMPSSIGVIVIASINSDSDSLKDVISKLPLRNVRFNEDEDTAIIIVKDYTATQMQDLIRWLYLTIDIDKYDIGSAWDIPNDYPYDVDNLIDTAIDHIYAAECNF